MPDQPKNTEWPEVTMAHHPDLGNGMTGRGRDGSVLLERVSDPEYPKAAGAWPTERYVPLRTIRERLTSNEAVAALARERFDYLSGYAGTRWEEAHESIRRQEEGKARLFLEAAFRAAFPDTKGQGESSDG